MQDNSYDNFSDSNSIIASSNQQQRQHQLVNSAFSLNQIQRQSSRNDINLPIDCSIKNEHNKSPTKRPEIQPTISIPIKNNNIDSNGN